MKLYVVAVKDKEVEGLGEKILSFGNFRLVREREGFVLYAGTRKEKLSLEDIRNFGGSVRKEAESLEAEEVSVDFDRLISQCRPYSANEIVPAFLEGWHLGGYVFDEYKKEKETRDVSLHLEEKFIEHGRIASLRADAVNFARTLCNEPANKLTPEIYAEKLKEVFKETDVTVEIIEAEELAERGFAATATVGRGSCHQPKVAVLELKNKEGKHIGLVGKGVTFDSGGTNVKTGGDIAEMKMDMGGSAAAAGAVKLLADLEAPVHVTAVLPLVENVAGGNAFLPSDVLHYANGLSVEVGNTDAEGRLVLADGMLHAQSLGAETVIDIATLTGAIGQALGLKVAGVFSNEEEDLWSFKELGEKTGDPVWPMPVIGDYMHYLKSDSADINNMSSNRFGGAVTAAVFLSNFVEKGRKWIHIDMANTVSPWKVEGYQVKGASGFGVRLLAEIVKKETDRDRA